MPKVDRTMNDEDKGAAVSGNDTTPEPDTSHHGHGADGEHDEFLKTPQGGMDARYLKELEEFLEAEAEMARQGVDLLADPEYRSLREMYIDGDIDRQEFVARVEALAESRPEDEGVSFTALDEAEAALAGDEDEGALGEDDALNEDV